MALKSHCRAQRQPVRMAAFRSLPPYSPACVTGRLPRILPRLVPGVDAETSSSEASVIGRRHQNRPPAQGGFPRPSLRWPLPVPAGREAFGAMRQTDSRASGRSVLNIGHSTGQRAAPAGLNFPALVRPGRRTRRPFAPGGGGGSAEPRGRTAHGPGETLPPFAPNWSSRETCLAEPIAQIAEGALAHGSDAKLRELVERRQREAGQ